jgi:lipoprotein NlpI
MSDARCTRSGEGRLALLAVCLWLALAAAAAHAQPAADAERCHSISNNPDLAIKHCTAAIDSGKFGGEALARLYLSRSEEWTAKGDYDRAIADASAALKLAPKMLQALHQRGVAWANKGEADRAIADFDAALALKPDNPAVLHARGVEHSVKGDYARAIADFDAALKLDPRADDTRFAKGRTLFYMSEFARAAAEMETAYKATPNAYYALWLYLARQRGNMTNAEGQLEREMAEFRGGWPHPVAVLFAGRTDPQSVRVAGTDPNPARGLEMRCEVDFYTAQWHIIKGASDSARPLLQQVLKSCPKNILEYEGALAELRRLK